MSLLGDEDRSEPAQAAQSCEESLACEQPPALFDEAAGLRWRRGAARAADGLVPRAVPPGSACDAFTRLRTMNATACAAAAAQLEGTRVGSTLRAHFEGCTLTGSVLRYAELSPSSTAHTARGQFVLCLGPASAPDGVPYAAPREGGA